jgi:hypothetical protein
MNLHNVLTSLRNVALWVRVTGSNGRSIGTHLWELEEGVPPDLAPKPSWQERAWWRPSRFSWQPFQTSLDLLFRTGYVRPICGKRSASRFPYGQFAGTHGRCADCVRVARERGIIALTQSEAIDLSPRYAELRHEQAQWVAAGRPDQWPLPSPQ